MEDLMTQNSSIIINIRFIITVWNFDISISSILVCYGQIEPVERPYDSDEVIMKNKKERCCDEKCRG